MGALARTVGIGKAGVTGGLHIEKATGVQFSVGNRPAGFFGNRRAHRLEDGLIRNRACGGVLNRPIRVCEGGGRCARSIVEEGVLAGHAPCIAECVVEGRVALMQRGRHGAQLRSSGQSRQPASLGNDAGDSASRNSLAIVQEPGLFELDIEVLHGVITS